jgi:putative nucleotidyltransferase with HDIG domain
MAQETRSTSERSEPTLEELRQRLTLADPEDVDIVLVDDDRTSLHLLESYLEAFNYAVRSFASPKDALDGIRESAPAILITDLVMPGMTGISLAEEARSIDRDVAVLLVTSYGDEETSAATAGLSDTEVLAKPVKRGDLVVAVQRALLQRAAAAHHHAVVEWMYAELARNEDRVRDVTLGTLASLINAVDARSPHFRGHSKAVALQAAAVAQTLGLDEDSVEAVRTAGLLHDIGMIGIPDAVTQKPGALTPEETQLVRTHCEVGAEIIEPLRHLATSRLYILEHHERWDGSGYPGGKTGPDISTGGQIVGIAEAWTAILESRAYREGRSREEGLEMLTAHKGEWFSPEVTEALVASDVGLLG